MQIKKPIKKIGIVAIPNISVAGGFARVFRDLVESLRILKKEVYLLTPYKVDYKKIEEYHGPVKFKKIFYPGKLKAKFCRENSISRKLLKQEFRKMANEVDMIIDLDGGILERYLPNNFVKSRYIIWRVSCGHSKLETNKLQRKGLKRRIKDIIQILICAKDVPHTNNHKIYPIDDWTRKALIKYWHVSPEKFILYPEIKIEQFKNKNIKKKNQIIIFGRISPNKMIEDSIKIFYLGTKNYPEYKLVILGGLIPDSDEYLRFLKRLINNLKISDRVEIIGNPSFEKLKGILLESKIIIDSQREISLTLTSIEALAAGCIVLSHKFASTYLEILESGKYGFGFNNVKEGGKNLDMILTKLKTGKLNQRQFVKRANFFSRDNFIKRVGKILNEN